MKQYKPMLARPAEEPFSSDNWVFEVKWDGIRAISYIGEKLSIRSRNQKELIDNFPELSELNDLTRDTVLDGEIVVMKDGKPDFQTLIQRMQNTKPGDIKYMSIKFPATYIIFDILEKDGEELVDIPLLERKRILKNSVKEGKFVVLSLFVEETGVAYYRAALEKGLEGIMAKKKQSSYEPGKRSNNWLKIKQVKTCDCVIFGYTRGEGNREKTFGALILGLYDAAGPVFIGKVGTGFSQEDMEDMKQSLDKLKVEEETLPGVDMDREITWLRPAVVCEVGYQSITDDGKLRIPVLKRFREDKDPFECTIDQIRPSLSDYAAKRDFSRTTEPPMSKEMGSGKSFVVQEHHARRLHYDLRLEKDGVLKSWAVPKGIPGKSDDRRLAVQVEDHPLEYGKFEGTIPEGQYGAGTVKIWDKGLYESIAWGENKIEFVVEGEKMRGRYVLVKFKKAGENNWLLFKGSD
ncbi:MAG: non-homologous end-joining DNA ligase [Candidatus Methanoperedens sp.]|nr:non-homologous end-joining DNA ligase [Candidatus Methanoperedens sp.]MCZ7394373.1 non-homologous end-joining DNA ligase [Candidatus Methanoperedens sp.]